MKVWLPNVRARSGADVYVRRLARALQQRGVEPVVQWFPHALQYVPSALRAARMPAGVDVIGANSWNAFAFQRASVPLVVTVHHCVAGRGYPEWKSRAQAIFHDHCVRHWERASFRAASAIVTISDSTRHDICADYAVQNVHTIPLWVDTDVFSPAPAATPRSPRGPCRILIIGNMGRRKGGDLIAPLCNALGRGFEVTVVAGLRGEAPRVAARGAAMQFRSGLTQAQLVACYREADIVVSLSRHEGFGYTALEGMACGKPVVAFNVSGLRDVIVDGSTGILVAPEDVPALADACRRLRDNADQAAQMGKRGRERAVTVFPEDRALEAHIQLYAGLLPR